MGTLCSESKITAKKKSIKNEIFKKYTYHMMQQSHYCAFIPEKPMYTIHMHTQGEATLTLAIHLSYLEAINQSN